MYRPVLLVYVQFVMPTGFLIGPVTVKSPAGTPTAPLTDCTDGQLLIPRPPAFASGEAAVAVAACCGAVVALEAIPALVAAGPLACAVGVTAVLAGTAA
jgi:hypothetical protein